MFHSVIGSSSFPSFGKTLNQSGIGTSGVEKPFPCYLDKFWPIALLTGKNKWKRKQSRCAFGGGVSVLMPGDGDWIF